MMTGADPVQALAPWTAVRISASLQPNRQTRLPAPSVNVGQVVVQVGICARACGSQIAAEMTAMARIVFRNMACSCPLVGALQADIGICRFWVDGVRGDFRYT